MSSERLAHEKEIEKLQQEIALVKELTAPVLNAELPVVENKLKESNSSNNIHDDDEMVCLSNIIMKNFLVSQNLKCTMNSLVFRFC
jgi:hypothetical protein